MLKPIIVATAIAGTLDILAAFFFAGRAGMGASRVLHFVASGPFGDRALTGSGFAAIGLFVHFAIMASMVAVFMLAAVRLPLLLDHPIVAGAVYGMALWFVMYWVVRPARWPGLTPSTDPAKIAEELFCHVIVVGIPIALVARHYLRATVTSAAVA
jgi:hypothetical protein